MYVLISFIRCHNIYKIIRRQAKVKQSLTSRDLLSKHADPLQKHFIQMFTHASWTSSPQTTRLWQALGNCKHCKASCSRIPITNHSRYTYIKLAKTLTAPLLNAYHQMIHINTRHNPRYGRRDIEPLPIFEQHIHTDHNLNTSPRAVLETTFEHSAIEAIIPTVPSHSLYTPIHNNTFAISDAAFSLEGADVTL
jgi:hypothetical protein